MAGSKDPDKEQLKKILTPEQYRVMCENGTEQPFNNAYWNNKRQGIYVDPITKEALFSSTDKFDSATGWPSFTQPIRKENVKEEIDKSYGTIRTEVRSSKSDSHLGHIFDDGPQPTGLRYCINSAALKFIPVEDMEKQGYGEYLYLFKKSKNAKTEIAAFAAGCFWGVEAAFMQVKGVINTRVGYAGGTTENPTYEEVCADKTYHAESVEVEYDPKKVSYKKLLDVFWSIHDPTTPNRQGPDMGSQYRSVIFYHTPSQGKSAQTSKEKLQTSKKFKNKKIVTEIIPAGKFWLAEEYHQKYYKKHNITSGCPVP